MSNMDLDYYWYWFMNIPSIGSLTRVKLMERFGHPWKLYDVKEQEIQDILTQEQIFQLGESRNYKRLSDGMKRLHEEGIQFIHWESPEYPEKFRDLFDPPYGFYLKGRLPMRERPAVAIVGSRRSTPYGRKMAEEFSSVLSRQGITIISGMAAGIDAVAHRAALEQGGTTLGILGGGIDTMYPKSNWNLYLDMYEHGGILSEFNLGVANVSGLFPIRNRLISGLSDIVLVVEAGMKSGSLITADQGMEQGKDVYAIPGRITDPSSVGCNHLIAQGAFLAESPQELLMELQKRYPSLNMKSPKEKTMLELTPEEARIMELLDLNQPVSFETILMKTGESIRDLQHILMKLEAKSYVISPQQNMYLKKF